MMPVVIPIFVTMFLASVAAAAYVTNPFAKLSIVRRPFVVEALIGTYKTVNNNHKLVVRQQVWWRYFAIVKTLVHILHTRYVRSPRSKAASVEGIIADIHTLRFDPKKLLLISGDHFNALFVRNLGVFYYPMLDTRIAGDNADWHNRQTVYLQTVAYALGVFEKHPVPATTIIATGPYAATCVNFHAYPSDTVYGILYALAALKGEERALPGEDYAKPVRSLDTVLAANALTKEYFSTLQKLYEHYRSTAFDEQTGLVSTKLHMSGAKDITRRNSAFYDNVIFWKTTSLAMRLGLIPEDKTFLHALKRRILQTFWLADKGHFLEDLSAESRAGNYYSSDWLIVLATGFLHPRNRGERHYFTQSISYIQQHKIDKPFALKYQQEKRGHRQFFLVRLTVASYGGNSIWSFWGMEYIKALLLLYKHTGEASYLKTADYHIKAYERIMLRDGGFPEVYDQHGDMLKTPIYRSIRQTGWVIGFEQVKAMRKALQ